jgi:hypothetical protein
MEDVTEIKGCAFCGNREIEEFNWPKGCAEIPKSCFDGCEKLTYIYEIEDVRIIGSDAFASCGFEKFDWPANCPEIPNRCFNSCKSLRTINISGEISSIGEASVSHTKIPEIDVSDSFFCKVSPNFAGIDNEYGTKIILPFYQQQEDGGAWQT